MINIKFKKVKQNAKSPSRSRDTDAGWDIYSTETILLKPGKTVKVPTGICVQTEFAFSEKVFMVENNKDDYLNNLLITGLINQFILENFNIYIQGESRSSLASLGIHWIGGVIDKEYTGEIIVILANSGQLGYTIKEGEKIAQIVVNLIPKTSILEVDTLDETRRGERGFGSSGKV
jgi:dUTP pyrophosphatase